MNANHTYPAKELFTRISRGDELAYKQLFHQYFQQLITVLIQYTHLRTDAEDIVQSVFLKIWEKRQELYKIENPENWLFITARNEFLGRFRKLRSEDRYRRYLTQVFEQELDAGGNVKQIQQRDQMVHRAIALLPEKQREAFFLSRYKNLTYEEIAEEMQISRATVKEHISRALKTIKLYLLEHKDELLSVAIIFYYFFHLYVRLFQTGCVFTL